MDGLDGAAEGRFAGLEQGDVPEGSAGAVGVGVEGVDAVVLGGDVEDVVLSAVDGDVGHEERLSVGVAVGEIREEFAEGCAADGGRE